MLMGEKASDCSYIGKHMSQSPGTKAMPSMQEQRESSLHRCSEAQGLNLLALRSSLAEVPPDEIRSGNSAVFFKDKEYRVEFNKNSTKRGILLHFLFQFALVQYRSSWLLTATKLVWGE